MRPLTLRTVLVATDLGPSSDDALDTAHRLASAAGAALHVVYVRDQQESEETDGVQAALRRAKVPPDGTGIHVIPGAPADTIRALADRVAADVIVVGPHRERVEPGRRDTLGGTARAIAERAYAPCLIAPKALRLPLGRVLVPIDLSDTARGALLVGLSWASALRAGAANDRATSLTVLHVDAPDEDASTSTRTTSLDRELATLEANAGGWAGVVVRGVTHQAADVATAIAEYAANQRVDLVVVGTRGLGLDEVARLGSVSASVVTRLETPMLLVPHAVWRVHARRP